MSTGNETFDPYAQWLGLNLREQPLDHYLLLGLARFEADPAVIERHADERMRLVRSFQTGPRGRFTQKLMNELAAAKLCLLSPTAKQAYDQQLQLWTQGASHPSALDSAALPNEEFVPELPPTAAPEAYLAPDLVPPPISELEAPPIGPAASHSAPADAAADEEVDEDESGPTSMALVVVGLTLGFIGVGMVGWMFTSYAVHRGWLPGGPAQGGPPAAMVGKATGQSSSPSVVAAESDVGGAFHLNDAIEVLQEGSGDVLLSPATASASGNVTLELEGTEDVLAGWQSSADSAAWRFRLIQPGFFEVQVLYAAGDQAFGRKLQVLVDGTAKPLELQPTTDGYRTDLQVVALQASGVHELRLSQAGEFDGDLRVKLVRLRAIASTGN